MFTSYSSLPAVWREVVRRRSRFFVSCAVGGRWMFQHGLKTLAGRLCLGAGCLLPLVASAHLHIQVTHGAGGWRLFLFDFESGEADPAVASLQVREAARAAVPNAPAYTQLLGAAGGPVWVLPQLENANLLYLGLGSQGIAPGAFQNNALRLVLKSVTGPGHFAIYTTDAFGNPQVRMNTRDGVSDTADFYPLAAVGGHEHCNWAFSAPGVYRVAFAAEGTLAGGQFTQSAPVIFTFVVFPTLAEAPRLAAPQVEADGRVAFDLISAVGTSVEVWTSPDLKNWAKAKDALPATVPARVKLDAVAGQQLFLKVRRP